MSTTINETTVEATSSATNNASSSITTSGQFTTTPTTKLITSSTYFTTTHDSGLITTTGPQETGKCPNCSGLLAATVSLSVLLAIAITAVVILVLLHFTNKLDRFKRQRRVKKQSTAPSVAEVNQSRPSSTEDPDSKNTKIEMEQEASPNQYTKERTVTKPKKTPPLPHQQEPVVSAEYMEFEADPPPRVNENEQEYLPLGGPPMDGEAYEEIAPPSKQNKPKHDVIDPPPPIPISPKAEEPGPDEIYMNPPGVLYENYDGEVPIDHGFEHAKCVNPYVNQKVVEANKNDKDYLIMNKNAR
ncbi:unnamed protein product [Owenia fusiformis]|uniref:Uncharacterized protein n=1 Tax=Owenia fusiformis TaxID=6347 RepID=A0A8J1TB07_OWEFU|nr:unnamed protein product [Owenia fusiformis]